MTATNCKNAQLPPIPDDMAIAQFMLYCQHEARPIIDDGQPCLVDSKTGRTLNLSQLRQYTFGLANALSPEYNIGNNDRVMIISLNGIDIPVVVWSIHRAGGIVTGCSNPQFTADEICHQLRTVNVTFMIAHSTVFDISAQAARAYGLPTERIILMDKPGKSLESNSIPLPLRGTVPDLIMRVLSIPRCFTEQSFHRGEGKVKVALLAWSSGTTRTPKISHYGMIANVIQMAVHNRNSRGSHFNSGDTALGVLPFFHVAGLIINVCLSFVYSEALVIGQIYGMTELTVAATMLSGDQTRGPLGSGGRLLPGIEYRVVRPDGTPSEPDEPGELYIKSPAAALGYWGNGSAKPLLMDGYVRGDQVIVTPDREVHVLDRIKEFIKVRAFQVAPAELEGSLLSHSDVIDCCVVGVEDERSGELPLAFVVLSADARRRSLESPQAAANIKKNIQRYISERKVRYKHLEGGVEFIEVLPRNGSGKLLRRVLRQHAREDKKRVLEQHPSKL